MSVAAANVELAAGGSGGSLVPLLLIVGLLALTYFMMIRPQSKRRRAMMEMQASITTGTEVVTIGGLYGTVVESDEETVLVEAAPGTVLRFARGAISKVVEPVAPEADTETAESSATPEDKVTVETQEATKKAD